MTSRADVSSMWPVRKTWRWRSESAAGTSARVFGAELDGFLLSQEVQAYVVYPHLDQVDR